MTSELRNSTVDGHPYRVADRDSWTRSRDKNFVRKTATTYLRRPAGHPTMDRKELIRLATREPRRNR